MQSILQYILSEMSKQNIFHLLQLIVRKYSKAAVRLLMENYLRIKLIYNLSQSALHHFLSPHLPLSLLSIFTKRSLAQKHLSFSCLIIDHPHLPSITDKILKKIQDCIVLDSEMKQHNNILGLSEDETKKEERIALARMIFFKSERESFQTLTEQIDAYLSICELFHAHIHLTFNCFEPPSSIDLAAHSAPLDGDEFEGVEEGYFRILEERASRVTLEELSETCSVERMDCGEALVFEGGHDGVVVWITQKWLPLLALPPPLMLPSSRAKTFLHFQASPLGYRLWKRRSLLKEPIEDLNLTTVIFNVEQWSPATEKAISGQFDKFCKRFFSEVVVACETKLLQENVRHAQRICQLLAIDTNQLLLKLLQP